MRSSSTECWLIFHGQSPSQSTETTQLNNVEPKAYNGASGSRYTVHRAQLTASWNQLHVGCWWGRKTGDPENKPRSKEENQHKLNPLMASGPGIEPGPHWWETSALTTTPSLLPWNNGDMFQSSWAYEQSVLNNRRWVFQAVNSILK